MKFRHKGRKLKPPIFRDGRSLIGAESGYIVVRSYSLEAIFGCLFPPVFVHDVQCVLLQQSFLQGVSETKH